MAFKIKQYFQFRLEEVPSSSDDDCEDREGQSLGSREREESQGSGSESGMGQRCGPSLPNKRRRRVSWARDDAAGGEEAA